MTQFEVFVAGARASYPFVVVLQADVVRGGRERALADRRDDILAAIDYLFFGV